MIEILAAVTLLGILSTMAVAAYTRYMEKSREQANEVMASSAKAAAEDFVMDYPGEAEAVDVNPSTGEIDPKEDDPTKINYVSFKDLVNDDYLDNIKDPRDKNAECRGEVLIGIVKRKDDDYFATLDRYVYEVYECCANHNYKYTYSYKKEESDGSVKEITKKEKLSDEEIANHCPIES